MRFHPQPRDQREYGTRSSVTVPLVRWVSRRASVRCACLPRRTEGRERNPGETYGALGGKKARLPRGSEVALGGGRIGNKGGRIGNHASKLKT